MKKKKAAKAKLVLLNFKATPEEIVIIRKNAKGITGGNMSLLIRTLIADPGLIRTFGGRTKKTA